MRNSRELKWHSLKRKQSLPEVCVDGSPFSKQNKQGKQLYKFILTEINIEPIQFTGERIKALKLIPVSVVDKV